MIKLKIGDVFEIETPKGKAYIQYAYSNKKLGELVRVLPGLYNETPKNLTEIAQEKELFLVHYPLKAATKQGLVKYKGKFELPNNFTLPKNMRSRRADKNGNLICWEIVDYESWHLELVDKLNKEQIKLSPWGIWNHALLVETLAEGWTLDKWI